MQDCQCQSVGLLPNLLISYPDMPPSHTAVHPPQGSGCDLPHPHAVLHHGHSQPLSLGRHIRFFGSVCSSKSSSIPASGMKALSQGLLFPIKRRCVCPSLLPRQSEGMSQMVSMVESRVTYPSRVAGCCRLGHAMSRFMFLISKLK